PLLSGEEKRVAAGLFAERSVPSMLRTRRSGRRSKKQPQWTELVSCYALVALFANVEYCMLESTSKRIGKRTWKVAPHPISLSAQILPLCASTICLAIARPRPVPCCPLVL